MTREREEDRAEGNKRMKGTGSRRKEEHKGSRKWEKGGKEKWEEERTAGKKEGDKRRATKHKQRDC